MTVVVLKSTNLIGITNLCSRDERTIVTTIQRKLKKKNK